MSIVVFNVAGDATLLAAPPFVVVVGNTLSAAVALAGDPVGVVIVAAMEVATGTFFVTGKTVG